ncbi:MAG: sulfite oxidase-like oxidoreductase [Rhodospirillales bacterium]|nr:sulfite oxidase-like oxidoreductase [Rhodospirillales bacterium]
MTSELDEKLIAAKEKWAREKRHQSGPQGDSAAVEAAAKLAARPAPGEGPTKKRLPPGQHKTDGWPVLDLGMKPFVPLKDWSFTVTGLVETPVTWSWEDFQAQPQVEIKADIHCVTSWSMFNGVWGGVSAKHFLSVVKPKPEAKFLLFRSYDSYSTNVPLARFDDDDVMLAHRWNGQPIDRDHGGPMRPIIPKLYFWKSAKWVRSVAFLAEDQPGYWEVRGYHNDADPWKEERYSGD